MALIILLNTSFYLFFTFVFDMKLAIIYSSISLKFWNQKCISKCFDEVSNRSKILDSVPNFNGTVENRKKLKAKTG